MREAARKALARHGYRGPEARLALGRRRDGLAREVAELDKRISWWDRVVFFSDTPDEARLGDAKKELAALEAELERLEEADDRALAAAGVELPPLRIVLRAGQAFRWFQSTLAHAGDEHAATAKLLDALAEDLRSTFLPGADVNAAIDALAARLERQQAEPAASEAPTESPLLAAHFAALGAAAVLTGVEIPERNFGAYGLLVPRRTGHLGLAAHALVEMLHAVDAAFPGLLAFATGITLSGARARRTAGDQSAYRTPGAPVESAAPLHASEAEARLFVSLDELRLTDVLSRGADHALVARAFGSRQGCEQKSRWHSEMSVSVAQRACAMVSQAGATSFEIPLRDLLLEAHYRMEAVRTDPVAERYGGCQVQNLEPALDAIDRLARFLGASIGVAGTRNELADAVVDHLVRSPPVRPPYGGGHLARLLSWPEVVVTVAEALRPTSFAADYASLRAATGELMALLPRAEQARLDVSLLDRVNTLTQSAAEKERDVLNDRANELRRILFQTGPRLEQQIDQALAFYPPAGLDCRRTSAGARAAQIQSVRSLYGNHRHPCQLLGKDDAAWALSLWNRAAAEVFGLAPSNGLLLARYALRSVSG